MRKVRACRPAAGRSEPAIRIKCVNRVHEEKTRMSKTRMNISVDEDTAERLRQYAWEHHSSVSKAISDLIWSAKVKNDQVRGQLSFTCSGKRQRSQDGE